MSSQSPHYDLYYWPSLPGRGEFVRLVLEDAGVPYRDVARLPESEGGGIEALLSRMKGKGAGLPVFAPPIVEVHEGDRCSVIAQMPNICHFLACRHGLVPPDEMARAQALTLMLTIADAVNEAHDLHHPVGKSLYYEDQKEEARRLAGSFTRERLPQWLDYFEAVLVRGGGSHPIGGAHSYIDLALFQLLEGLAYALPRAFARHSENTPALLELRARVLERPHIAAYFGSPRRLPFNESGIFRHYPELDVA